MHSSTDRTGELINYSASFRADGLVGTGLDGRIPTMFSGAERLVGDGTWRVCNFLQKFLYSSL
jgi:hypothetical protein